MKEANTYVYVFTYILLPKDQSIDRLSSMTPNASLLSIDLRLIAHTENIGFECKIKWLKTPDSRLLFAPQRIRFYWDGRFGFFLLTLLLL